MTGEANTVHCRVRVVKIPADMDGETHTVVGNGGSVT